MIVKQFFLLLAALFSGYALSTLIRIPIPANVLGFLLLFAALCLGIIKVHHVDKISDFIINYLALFFVVPTVGIMVHFDLISKQFLHILLPLLVSILLGYFTAAKVTELIIKLQNRKNPQASSSNQNGGGKSE